MRAPPARGEPRPLIPPSGAPRPSRAGKLLRGAVLLSALAFLSAGAEGGRTGASEIARRLIDDWLRRG